MAPTHGTATQQKRGVADAADVDVVIPRESPERDPGGTVITISDPEGNLWSFGTCSGEEQTGPGGTQ